MILSLKPYKHNLLHIIDTIYEGNKNLITLTNNIADKDTETANNMLNVSYSIRHDLQYLQNLYESIDTPEFTGKVIIFNDDGSTEQITPQEYAERVKDSEEFSMNDNDSTE